MLHAVVLRLSKCCDARTFTETKVPDKASPCITPNMTVRNKISLA